MCLYMASMILRRVSHFLKSTQYPAMSSTLSTTPLVSLQHMGSPQWVSEMWRIVISSPLELPPCLTAEDLPGGTHGLHSCAGLYGFLQASPNIKIHLLRCLASMVARSTSKLCFSKKWCMKRLWHSLKMFVMPIIRLADRGAHGGSLGVGKKILVCKNKLDLLPSVISQCDAMLT